MHSVHPEMTIWLLYYCRSGDFEHVPSFTVSSVYDMASEIGKDFEHLIDTYGVESISGIMPKVSVCY